MVDIKKILLIFSILLMGFTANVHACLSISDFQDFLLKKSHIKMKQYLQSIDSSFKEEYLSEYSMYQYTNSSDVKLFWSINKDKISIALKTPNHVCYKLFIDELSLNNFEMQIKENNKVFFINDKLNLVGTHYITEDGRYFVQIRLLK